MSKFKSNLHVPAHVVREATNDLLAQLGLREVRRDKRLDVIQADRVMSDLKRITVSKLCSIRIDQSDAW